MTRQQQRADSEQRNDGDNDNGDNERDDYRLFVPEYEWQVTDGGSSATRATPSASAVAEQLHDSLPQPHVSPRAAAARAYPSGVHGGDIALAGVDVDKGGEYDDDGGDGDYGADDNDAVRSSRYSIQNERASQDPLADIADDLNRGSQPAPGGGCDGPGDRDAGYGAVKAADGEFKWRQQQQQRRRARDCMRATKHVLRALGAYCEQLAVAAAGKVRRFLRGSWIALVALALCGLGLAMLGAFVFEPLPWQGWFTYAVILLLLTSLVSVWLPTHVTFLLADVVLMAFFIITPAQGLSGFSNSGVAAVAVLFIVADGIQRTSALRAVLRWVLGRPASLLMAHVRVCVPVALFSAFLNNTPIIVMMIGVVQRWTRFNGLSSSKILMPMNVAALMGGTCTLIGTSTNLVVVGLAQQAGVVDPSTGEPITFGIFDIGKIGVFNLLAGLVVLFTLARWLLRERQSATDEMAVKPREYTVAIMVQDNSPIVGLTVHEAGLRSLKGLFLFELTRKSGALIAAPGPDEVLQANDVLLFAGRVETVAELYLIEGLVPASTHTRKLPVQMHRRRLYEAVVSPFSSLTGKTVRETNFRRRYHGAIIAVHRGGSIVREKIGDILLRGGETLVVEAGEEFGERYTHDSDFSLVSEVSGSERPREDLPHMLIAGVLAALMVSIAAAGLMNIFLTASLAAFGMVFTGCLNYRQAGQAVDMPIMLTIATAFGVSSAMEASGAAAAMASLIVDILRPLGPIGLLFGIYVSTALMTNVITNNGAVSLMFSIVASPDTGIIARENLNPYAALYVLMIAGSSAYLTHIGYQTNLMVHSAANYKVVDWLKLGIPLQVVSAVVTVLVANMFYPSSG